jgi:hypothetical protein
MNIKLGIGLRKPQLRSILRLHLDWPLVMNEGLALRRIKIKPLIYIKL